MNVIIIRSHRSTTYVDVAYCYRLSSVVCLSVCLFCLSVTIVSPAKTAEPIDMSFELWTRVGTKNHVLDGGAHWRNLANTIEPFECGGEGACFVKLL